jgi:hypothetical protein
MHPEPPNDEEHWIRGEDDELHLPDQNEAPLCGHETDKSPFHYRQIGLKVESIEDWRREHVCRDCVDRFNG